MRTILLSVVFAAAPLAAQADLSVAVRASTLGFGAELSKLILPNVGVRAGVNTLTRDINRTQQDIRYDVELDFQSVSGLVDFFPSSRGSFHLTGGVISAPADIDGIGQPVGGNFTINGQNYTAAEVGTVTGTVRWPSALPYAGIGWGTPASRRGGLAFLFDLGVGIGTPALNLNATSAVPGSTLAADVAAEQNRVQDDVDRYFRVYPVVSIGLALRF